MLMRPKNGLYGAVRRARALQDRARCLLPENKRAVRIQRELRLACLHSEVVPHESQHRRRDGIFRLMILECSRGKSPFGTCPTWPMRMLREKILLIQLTE